MTYNQKNYKKTSATGVFHTDGLGVNPNDPSDSYQGWDGDLVDQGIDNTAGKASLTQFNQKAQVNNSGNQAPVDAQDLSRSYGSVLRQNS